jgi:hypothetical protein
MYFKASSTIPIREFRLQFPFLFCVCPLSQDRFFLSSLLLLFSLSAWTHRRDTQLRYTEYAAERCVDHAQFEDVSRNVEDGMKQPRASHILRSAPGYMT